MSDPEDTVEIRPRHGELHRGGQVIELRFIRTSDPGAGTYLAVTVDGEPLTLRPGDELRVDVIGPGQSVVFS